MSGTRASDPIGRPPGARKLIAVLYADMVGYSRLIGLDDAGTLERLRTLRSTLIDPTIDEHGGRIVNTGGDSLLIVFDSVEGAVRCAMKVQQQVPVCDSEKPTDRAIRFRVGINVGDVIPDGTDVHGEVVNVAARLQAECPPGGVCVSRAVRDHVQDRLDLAFEELGAINLKNISRPVEAFVVRPEAPMTVPKSVERALVRGDYDVLPLPAKPSIAVLAFTNMSGDLEQEYFSDGVAEDIITELSRSRSLFVIARNSSFTYKGRPVDVKQVARELGVRYVVEGSVRRSGGRIRVTAQLIDAETGNHIWAERYDRDVNEVFAVQDEITIAVTTGINPAVADAEQLRAMRKQPENLSAWEAYQRGRWHLEKSNATDNQKARTFLHRAITLDATFVPAFTAMGRAYLQEGTVFPTGSLQASIGLATYWAGRAVESDASDAEAHDVLVRAKLHEGISEESWKDMSLPLEISPNSSWAHSTRGMFLIFSGRPSQGRDELLTALRLSPRDPDNATPLTQIAISYYFECNYLGAMEGARRAMSRFPQGPLAYRWLAASLGQLGRTEDANDALRRAMAIAPSSFGFYVRSRPPWFRPEDYEHMLDGLRKAGWLG